MYKAPVQFAFQGSGCHSPLMHVDELGPIGVSPSLQLNVMIFPSSAGSS